MNRNVVIALVFGLVVGLVGGVVIGHFLSPQRLSHRYDCAGPAIIALLPIARNALPLKLLCCFLYPKEAE